MLFAALTAAPARAVVPLERLVHPAEEVVARQGDGKNYSPSFKDPLHAGTEFDVIETRPGWIHIKLFDDSDGWIPDKSAEMI